MTGKLDGKVAWVSGGASGMGEATARLFAAEGAGVAIADIQNDVGERIAVDITSRGGRALYVPCDVTREDEVCETLDVTAKHFGSLSILVNCAGVVHVKLLHEYSEKEWDRLMAVNVKSIFFSIKHGLKHLQNQRRSYMVNIGSIGSFISQAGTPAYIASKGAVLQLTRSIALDYAVYGLRANCVCPRVTETPMLWEHLSALPDPDAVLAARIRRIPMGVSLKPLDIAKAVLYFSCEDSSGITGTSLLVDGGHLATAEWEVTTPTAFMDCR